MKSVEEIKQQIEFAKETKQLLWKIYRETDSDTEAEYALKQIELKRCLIKTLKWVLGE